MTDAITAYEAEFGEITEAEIAAQQRADRAAAIVVRGNPGNHGDPGNHGNPGLPG